MQAADSGHDTMLQHKSNGPTLAILCSVMFIDAMSVGLILPVMPGLIGELSSLSNSEAARVSGELLTVFALMQFVCAPLLGALSDRFGRRNVILIAVFGLGIDYFIMAAAPSIFWLYVARIISGVCGATSLLQIRPSSISQTQKSARVISDTLARRSVLDLSSGPRSVASSENMARAFRFLLPVCYQC